MRVRDRARAWVNRGILGFGGLVDLEVIIYKHYFFFE